MATTTDNQEGTEDASCTNMATNLKSCVSLLFSLLNTVLSAFAAQFMALSSKAGVPGLQLIFLTKLVQLAAVLVVMPYFRPKLAPKDRAQALSFVFWTIIDNVATVLIFLSFVYVMPGIAFGIIQGSTPFFTSCLGFLVLKETVGVADSCGILFSVAGVIVVSVGVCMEDASSSYKLATSILLPISAAFSQGPMNVIQRSLIGVQGVSILTVTFHAQLWGTIALSLLTYILETPRWTMSTQTAGYVVGLCLCDAFSSFCSKIVLKLEKAGVSATLGTLVTPLTILLDYYFHSSIPSPMKLVGVTLVVFGTTVVGVQTWWVNRREMRHNQVMDSLSFGS